MTYSFREIGATLHIMHDETDECAGYVVPLKRGHGFSLHRGLPEMNDIAVIGSIEEAIPALATYYENHLPKWRRGRDTRFNWFYRSSTPFTVYNKWTVYGFLSVEWQEPRRWIAYRDGDALERDGRDAIFVTFQEAQRAADLHSRDGFPSSVTINDGFSWALPHLIPAGTRYP